MKVCNKIWKCVIRNERLALRQNGWQIGGNWASDLWVASDASYRVNKERHFFLDLIWVASQVLNTSTLGWLRWHFHWSMTRSKEKCSNSSDSELNRTTKWMLKERQRGSHKVVFYTSLTEVNDWRWQATSSGTGWILNDLSKAALKCNVQLLNVGLLA